MGRKSDPPAERFSRAVASELNSLMARKIPRITATQLAAIPEIGRSQNYISKRLRGVSPFTLDELDRICAFLGVDSAKLIHRVNEALQEGEENDHQ